MPKLWTDTIESHRHDVRQAILDAAGEIVGDEGLLAVTMSEVAERTGIGRATLYRYFPDIESILAAWHQREIDGHLSHLKLVVDDTNGPLPKLATALHAFATMLHARPAHDPDAAALLHQDPSVMRAQHELQHLLTGLIDACARSGAVRDDVPPQELATYCIHALSAARTLRSRAGVERLVDVTIAGLLAKPD